MFLYELVEVGEVFAVYECVVDADGNGHSAVSFHLAYVYQREVVAMPVLLGV